MLPVQAGAALDKMTSHCGNNTEKEATGKVLHGYVSNFSYALLRKGGWTGTCQSCLQQWQALDPCKRGGGAAASDTSLAASDVQLKDFLSLR